MHEIAAPSLITEVRVGLARAALCLRMSGPGLISALHEGGTLAVILAGPEARVVSIERSWLGVGTIIEAAVPFAAIGGSVIQFAIQLRDASGAVLETLPWGRSWTVAIPESASADWQA